MCQIEDERLTEMKDLQKWKSERKWIKLKKNE